MQTPKNPAPRRQSVTPPDYRLQVFLPCFEHIDELRAALHRRTNDLFDRVNDSPADVRASYHRFLQLGGSTASDLRDYLQGRKPRRYYNGASKGHGRLRLVSDGFGQRR